MTDQKKHPPMAKASREFLTGLELPPSNHSDMNIKLAALFGAMLLHCSGLKEDAETATCSPSQRQIADILHCSIKAVERLMQKARSLDFMTSQRRGDGLSSVYTIHKHPVQTRQLVTGQQTRQLVTRLKDSDPTRRRFRPDTLAVQTRQDSGSDPTTSVVLRDTPQEKNTQGLVSIGNPPNPPVAPPSDFYPLKDEQGPESPVEKKGLVIQATKKPELPECPTCQLKATDSWPTEVTRGYCRKHDNDECRLG
jgi:hypothetical protein